MTMKTLSLACLATAAFLPFTGCEGDEEHRHDHDRDHDRDHERGWHPTTTTTTEETTVRRPVSATTETQTIRTY